MSVDLKDLRVAGDALVQATDEYLSAKETAAALKSQANSADCKMLNAQIAAQKALDSYVECCRRAGIKTTKEAEEERAKRQVAVPA